MTDNLYISFRNPDKFPVSIWEDDFSNQLTIDCYYDEISLYLVGVEIKDNNILPSNYKISTSSIDNYSIIDFVKSIDDHILNQCYMECLYILPNHDIHLYKNQHNKIIRIAMYENNKFISIFDQLKI